LLQRQSFRSTKLREDQFWKFSFVYLYKTYYAKSLLHKYCKEGASVLTHFWVPTQKRKKIQEKYKKNIVGRHPDIYIYIYIYNSNENRMSERLENGQKLVEEIQKYKD
jgi:hypothetical protein